MKRIVLLVISLIFLVSCGEAEVIPQPHTETLQPEVEVAPVSSPEEVIENPHQESMPEVEVAPESPSEEVTENPHQESMPEVEVAPESPPEEVTENPHQESMPEVEKETTTAPQPEPEPKPEPAATVEEKKTLCTISVTCEKAMGKKENLPQNGVILNAEAVEFTEGESVFQVLERCLSEKGIALEYREDATFNSVYIVSIGPLSEKDCGAYSGWMYKVNGVPPTCASSEYIIRKDDVIEFYYSC